MTNPDVLHDVVITATAQAPQLRAIPARAGMPSAPAAETSEAALLAAIAYFGDEAAFERVYWTHSPAVIAAARHICRNSAVAQDIAQRTFMTLWERASRLATRSVRLRPWLITVARNAAIDYVRAENAWVALDEAEADSAASDCPQDAAVTNALMAELAPALAALSPEQRTVIELHYFGHRTFAAIAAQTGEPLSTVKSRARLAIEHLRRSIGA